MGARFLGVFILAFFFGLSPKLAAQTATVSGVVVNEEDQAVVDLANVYLSDFTANTTTNQAGRFELTVPIDKPLIVVVTRVGFAETRINVNPIGAGQTRAVRIQMLSANMDVDIVVKESKLDEGFNIREEANDLRRLPSTTGNLESVLPAIALGISPGTGGELSSQYNVRGGNYDENLVYVNDFEIYRPQLIRTGQQEGLTFANLDLAQSLTFSSGGFEARYGDKLSSVLSVRYKRPDEFKASVGGSALGASAHVEGSVKLGDSPRRLRYLVGARYKTTQYLLNTLDVTGEYVPNFVDIQGFFTYDLTESWQLGALINYNRASYEFAPEERSTGFGLINIALELQSSLDGQEDDDFKTGMGGVSLTYVPDRDKNPLYLKFLGSGFNISEIERLDIVSAYSLREIESNIGSDQFGTPVRELGSGVQQRFIRNFLTSNIYNFTHLGGLELQPKKEGTNTKSNFVQWGLTAKYEDIADRINEWERLDSAGFSLPFNAEAVELEEVFQSRNRLDGLRFSSFLQNTWTYRKEGAFETRLNLGVRGGYWTVNEEAYVTPRGQLLIKPLNGKRDISYRLAGGLYYQPPFYRELRRETGELNLAVQSQKSLHAVGGMTWDYNAKKSGRPFRFIAEAYYKRLTDLVSYEVDNVRIRYSGDNDATGYVAGLDMRLNGEFVKGTESWFNLSILRAREALDGVEHLRRELNDTISIKEVSSVPRPTDQFATLSVFFQDYFPKNENLQVNLTTTIGSGLPYGLPDDNTVFRNTFRFAAYRRVDIGFTAQLWRPEWRATKPRHFLRGTDNAWLSFEVFNMLAIQNEASKTWVKTVFRQQFAIPNFLTGRRLNLRFRVEF